MVGGQTRTQASMRLPVQCFITSCSDGAFNIQAQPSEDNSTYLADNTCFDRVLIIEYSLLLTSHNEFIFFLLFYINLYRYPDSTQQIRRHFAVTGYLGIAPRE